MLSNLAGQAMELGDDNRAIASYEAAAAIASAVGQPEPMVLTLYNLAHLNWRRGDGAAAARRLEEALALARKQEVPRLVPNILILSGIVTADLGDFPRAEASLREGLRGLGPARGHLVDVIDALEGIARVAAATGRGLRAARLFGAAAALRDEIATPHVSFELAYFEPILAGLRDALGSEQFAAAWANGRALSRAEAVAEGLAIHAEPIEPPLITGSDRVAARHGLTEREREVLRLLAAGHSNHAIGERLFISPLTVARHLTNLYAKIGVGSRAQAIAFAHRYGLG
jgi:ATP/maltotriose-dependent transcriptional regulator MalT